MIKKIFIIVSVLVVIAVIGYIFIPPLMFAHGMWKDISLLESRLCSEQNYEPVAKDLALICSNINSATYTSDVKMLWWPDSIRKLKPIHGYLSPDKASVLFTCGFSHLSYKLEKITDESKNTITWSFSFDDEGRNKHLTTIELSKDESSKFEIMLQEATIEYDRLIKENPDSTQLVQQKEKFLSLFDKTETE